MQLLSLLRVRTQGEGGCLHARKQAPTRNHLDLVFSASKTVGNKHLLFNPPALWYFLTAAPADWDKEPSGVRARASRALSSVSSGPEHTFPQQHQAPLGPGRPIRDAGPGFCWGWSRRHPWPGTNHNSRFPQGKQVFGIKILFVQIALA